MARGNVAARIIASFSSIWDYSDDTPDVTYTYDRAGRTKTVEDALGFREFTYNTSDLQLLTETMNPAGGGLYSKTITRSYQGAGGVPGRVSGFSIGGSGYTVGYYYDDVGRLERITGPGLPTYGAVYSRLANSELVEYLRYQSTEATTLASVRRGYLPDRDLVEYVENTRVASPAGTISRYEYANDELGRRTSVLMTGSAFIDNGGEHHWRWGYNDRSELTVSHRCQGTTLTGDCTHMGYRSYTKYTWGLDLSGWAGDGSTGGIHGAGGIGGLLGGVDMPSGGVSGWAFSDANGNVVQIVVNTAGYPVFAHYESDPFGYTTGSGTYAGTNPFRFSTKWMDDVGGYYYGYRFYSTTHGRFLSRDPHDEAGWRLAHRQPGSLRSVAVGPDLELLFARLEPRVSAILRSLFDGAEYSTELNLLLFVKNDPTRLVDPLGTTTWAKEPWYMPDSDAARALCAILAAIPGEVEDIFSEERTGNPRKHCLWNCYMHKWCGDYTAVSASIAKEIIDVIICLTHATPDWKDWCDSAFQGSDFRDNAIGRKCPDDKDCKSHCTLWNVKPGTPEGDDERPYGPLHKCCGTGAKQ
jgi:RHS repeat-associated protein